MALLAEEGEPEELRASGAEGRESSRKWVWPPARCCHLVVMERTGQGLRPALI